MEAPESMETETTIRHEQCNECRRMVGTRVPGSDGRASFSQQGNDVIDFDRFQDTGNRGERSCTLVPRSPNHCTRNRQE